MQIDWLTVAAQLVNFLVLIWLLKRFLYGPVTKAMAEREQRIAERLGDARRVREEAVTEAEALRAERQALDSHREAEMAKARAAAEALRQELEADLREDMEQKRAAWLDHLQEDRTEIVLEMQKRTAAHVGQALRRVLADFAGADLAEQMAAEFARQLSSLDLEERRRLERAAEGMPGAALVECSMELPSAARRHLTRAIHDEIAEGIKVDYASAGDVTFGIRLTLGHQVLDWSAGRYLDRLGLLIEESLDAVASEAADAA